MFRKQNRLTLLTSAGHQHAWQSSSVCFRVGSPEPCRFVISHHGNYNASNIRNFTAIADTSRRRRSHHQHIVPSSYSSLSSPPLPSQHCLIDLKSSLMSSLIIKSNSRLRYEKKFSTHASSNSDSNTATEKTPTASDVASSLRRMIKPFLLKCHPDIQQQRASNDDDDDDNASISQDDANWAKAINLRAIQNLNSYLDSIQTLLHESSSSSSSVRQRHNLKNDSSSLVDIDFVIAIQSSSSSLKSGGKKRHQSRRNRGIEWHQSRRKVQLVLPQQHVNVNNNMSFLERHVHSELVRLLRVAGLEVPMYSFHSLQQNDYNKKDGVVQGGGANDARHPKGPFWHDSFHFPFGAPQNKKSGRVSSSTTTSASSSIFSRYKANREDYVRDTIANKNWNNETRFFQLAMAECFMEDETRGLISNDAARRQDLIAHILAKVQIQKQQQQVQEEQEDPFSSTTNNDENDNAADAATTTTNSSHNNIVVVDDAGLEQLLAMRRLSLVLDDNFQILQLEELGRLWENLTLVLLLPPPSSWDNDYHDDDEDNTPPSTAATSTTPARRRIRRTKRRRRRHQMQQQYVINPDEECWQMMDYAWTLHPDWSVTMHIPMDFEPDELVQELERNVQDFNRLLEEQTYHDYNYYHGSGGGGFPYNHHSSYFSNGK